MNKHIILLAFIIIVSLIGCKTDKNETGKKKEIVQIEETKNDPYTIFGEHHFLHGYSAKTASNNINVVVEIPTGSIDKWEVNKEDGSLQWQMLEDGPRKVNYLGYPGNYGMIPQTYLPKELGGDGDPLDVIVLGPAVERGNIIECKIIGVIEILDRGEQDDKLVAVMKDSPFYEIESIAELNEYFNGALNIITTWFANYKGPNKMEILKIAKKERAEVILEAAIKAYQEANQK